MNDESSRQGASATYTDVARIGAARTPSCHICGARCERETTPAAFGAPARLEPDVWWIRLRNGAPFPACHRCWFMWPDTHKISLLEGAVQCEEAA